MKKRTVLVASLVVAVVLLATAGSVGANPSQDEPSGGGAGLAVVVSPLLQYQARLTNPSTGDPIADGDYAMTFRLYEVDAGGTALWSESKDVAVANGLLSTALGDTAALDQNLFHGQGLWLQIEVEGEVLSPRQQIMPVAYAFSLVPGAVVAEDSSSAILTASNTGAGEGLRGESAAGHGVRGDTSSTSPGAAGVVGVAGWSDTTLSKEVGVLGKSAAGMGLAGVSDTGFAVYGLSHGTYGVRGDSVGTGYGIYGYNSGTGYAGYFNGDVTVTGQLKGSDTYLWVPGTAGIAATTLGVNVETWYYGRVALKTSAAGDNRYFYFPVSIPGQLYGQNVTVEQLTVYYYTSNSASYINSTTMYKLTGAATAESIASDTTNHASTSATSYSVTTTGNRTLSSASGPLNIRLQLYFGSTSHTIYIGGVRLRLSHTS